MKNFKFIVLALAAVVLCGCGADKSELLTVKTFKYDKSVLASDNEKEKMQISMQIEYPTACAYSDMLDSLQRFVIDVVFNNEIGSEPLSLDISPKEAMKIRADRMCEVYKEDNSFLLSDDAEDKLEMSRFFDAEYDLSAAVCSLSGDVMSYMVNTYSYYGGAHGMTTVYYYNIDLKTGEELTEKNIYPDVDSQALAELLQAALLDQTGLSRQELEERGYDFEALQPNENFYLSDDSVFYYFNAYEIAPYCEGGITIALPR